MKITPDNMARLKDAVRLLDSLPFSVTVETISPKPTVQLFLDREAFRENFPDCESESTEYAEFLTAEQDGILFIHCETRERDHD